MDDWFDTDVTSDVGDTDETTHSDPTAARALSVVNNTDSDDDWFTAAAPEPAAPTTAEIPTPRTASAPARRRGVVVAVGALAALLALAGGAAVLVAAAMPGDTQNLTIPESATPTLVPATPTPAPPWCSGLAAGEPASTSASDPGAATIAGFETAYYERRDAGLARSYVAADAHVGSIEELGAGIASVPSGTRHCVLTTRLQPGLYAVDLFTRTAVGGALEQIRQTITTVDSPTGPKGALITSISAREGK
ncbi:hypothetical protein [Nocardia sp. NPDC060249]|uniref:hypothetical protein n=1 Tax=Nocardia sp. NPDC060249 TaxID=3347082 RepID=UPI00366732A1